MQSSVTIVSSGIDSFPKYDNNQSRKLQSSVTIVTSRDIEYVMH